MEIIREFSFDDNSIETFDRLDFGKNWPVVYILEGGREAYVGETTSVRKRTKDHLSDGRRKKIERIHVITDGEFNKSVALDIESKLIEYMSADGKYLLQNSNRGLRGHDYYRRTYYDQKFRMIWEELRNRRIAQNTLLDIENSDLFKFSPFKVLTDDQLEIVEAIEETVMGRPFSTSVIKGEPGSGKTVLAIYMIKYFLSNEEIPLNKVGIVLPMTSLRGTVGSVFKNIKGLKVNMVMGPNQVVNSYVKDEKPFDLLIVDEAHRLSQRRNLSSYVHFDEASEKLGLDSENASQLDWMKKTSKHLILFYDGKQSVRPSDVEKDHFDKLDADRYVLSSQLRSKAGDDYPVYVESILRGLSPEKETFYHYEFILFERIEEMVQRIKSKDSEVGLSRIVAGYAWEWKSKTDSDAYDIHLGDNAYRWNSVNKDWINSEHAIDEIGCIHTVQGYDLNYVGVIVGPELVMRGGEVFFVQENYHDRYGKHSSKSAEEMLDYIINIYKTLMTRGIRGTYLYICDEELREYVKGFVDLG